MSFFHHRDDKHGARFATDGDLEAENEEEETRHKEDEEDDNEEKDEERDRDEENGEEEEEGEEEGEEEEEEEEGEEEDEGEEEEEDEGEGEEEEEEEEEDDDKVGEEGEEDDSVLFRHRNSSSKASGGASTKLRAVLDAPHPRMASYADLIANDDDDDLDDETQLDDQHLQKFNQFVHSSYLLSFHPESIAHSSVEIQAMSVVTRDASGAINDPLHRTLPILFKYEKARTLGQRAKQLNSGAPPFVKVSEDILDGHLIAEMELKEKKIPFIIRRPLPNGGSEYWRVKDLEDISF